MKAIVCTGYGSPEVLKVLEMPKLAPAAGEILIRVRATTVTSGDWRIRRLEMPPGFGLVGRLIFGLSKPRQLVLGSEVAGEVESVGEKVSNFQRGDRVVAFSGAKMGCHAQFKCMKASGCVVGLPDEIDFETAAALPFGGTTALHFLRTHLGARWRTRRGDRRGTRGLDPGAAARKGAWHQGGGRSRRGVRRGFA
jgi:NADPH:quinone reductase-like Zn-dependent oxidoreductase